MRGKRNAPVHAGLIQREQEHKKNKSQLLPGVRGRGASAGLRGNTPSLMAAL